MYRVRHKKQPPKKLGLFFLCSTLYILLCWIQIGDNLLHKIIIIIIIRLPDCGVAY